ncbi:hypothetical protein ACFSC6_05995, partial [Rufibacter sediminis]|uniref:Uncharacterized protein n=1 Tax=Rufibacter sediminis TaxID=2762756 RepID=A0ABR6VVM1_9BACT|nr:hypothetical protein [Rufibacter sediminis]MBC3541198.1 hypothetical protein [Rufibacter sediminis]
MELELSYIDSRESFGMSGPWIGKLKVDGHELRYEYLDGNYVRTNDAELYAFNCFQPERAESRLFGLFKIVNQTRMFRIIVFIPTIEKWFISKDYWSGMYLTRMTKEEVFFTEAFHDGDREMFPEKSINLGDENFEELNEEEIRKTPHNIVFYGKSNKKRIIFPRIPSNPPT